MNRWAECKNILCIRADNMGDVLMSSPAIAALKETFDCKITVLTSSAGAAVCTLIPEIDEVIPASLPWVKQPNNSPPVDIQELLTNLKSRQFDGCVIFTVYSQSSLPAALLAFMAAIPLITGYCRENPYHLMSHWLPDPEPYNYIVHQVERDLALVESIGGKSTNRRLRLSIPKFAASSMRLKLLAAGIGTSEKYIVLHAGVSEAKRKYPEELWVQIGKLLLEELGFTLLLTGSSTEESSIAGIATAIGAGAYNVCGQLSLAEFAAAINKSVTVLSVNTGTVHLASALKKPLVVLYARTNPQHLPWMVSYQVLEFSVPQELASKNQVINHVNEQYYQHEVSYPSARQVVDAVMRVLLTSYKDRRNCQLN